MGSRRICGLALAGVVLVTGAPPAVSAIPERSDAPRAHELRPPALPPDVEALFARQRQSGSNAMFAQLVTKPHKGYQWMVVAFKPSPSSKTLLAIRFARTRARGTQMQSSEFRWTLPRGALKMDADLRPASLVTRKSMGNNGSIAMKLAKAGRYVRFPAEEPCRGSISFRISRFKGRFRFNARDRYFKRIDFRGGEAFLYREHGYECPVEPAPPACPQDLSLSATDAEAGVAIGAFKTPEGKVDQTVVVARKSGKADSLHMISVMIAVPEAFEASEDMTTASLDGDAAGPWLSGDLSYVGAPGAEATDEECGLYRTSSGLATGDYTAHFDSIGPVTPATTGLPATLRREL
jgi:hypothetical protein